VPLLSTYFIAVFNLGLFLDLADGGDMIARNVN
jgi:hypothetical protein